MSSNKPKFNSKAERVRFAVRKKYVSEDEWTNQEIADELNVSQEVVSRYLNNTPAAQDVKRARESIEREEWRQLLIDLKSRVEKLNRLEDQLWDVVEPVVTGYKFIDAEAEISDFHLQDGGNSVALEMDEDDRPETEVEVPIPDRWEEIPEFSRLRKVWEERRRTEEQLSNLLGLEADETVNVEGELTERKIFEIDDGYPDATPHEVGEDPDSEVSTVDDGDSGEESSSEDSEEEDK
jgi:predicted transcriptional regulator